MYLSIITVNYNNKKGLERTLASIIPLPDECEWIIIDAYSNDGTREMLNSLTNISNIHWFSEPDKGIFDGMNKGINNANGKYLCFMNSGDYFSRKSLEKIINDQTNGFDVLVFNYIAVDENLVQQNALPLATNPSFLRKRASIPHQSTLIKKDLFKLYGNYSLDFPHSGDYEFFARVYATQKVSFKIFPDIFLAFFVLDGLTSHLNNSHIQGREHYKIQQKYFKKGNIIRYLIFLFRYYLSWIPYGEKIFKYMRKYLLSSRRSK